MAFVPDKKSSFVPDKKSSFVPDEKASVGSVLTQLAIGAGNAAAYGVPELLDKKDFDKLASSNPINRFARGTGTAFGTALGLPGIAFKIGSKIALKGTAKLMPKIIESASKGSRYAKAALEG